MKMHFLLEKTGDFPAIPPCCCLLEGILGYAMEVIVTIVGKLFYLAYLTGPTSNLYRGYNPFTNFHGHSSIIGVITASYPFKKAIYRGVNWL